MGRTAASIRSRRGSRPSARRAWHERGNGKTVGIDPALIGIISAATALTASITGPMVSLYVARAQIRASVRSANRQRWIEDFRDTIARLSGQIAVATQLRDRIFAEGRIKVGGEADLRAFEQLIATATKVRLLSNPLDADHRRLIGLLDELLQLFRTAGPDDDLQGRARGMALQLGEASLKVIRHEWMRVQSGA